MRILLIKNVNNLGNKKDIVNVSSGYAMNYLIPKKFAILITKKKYKNININKKKYEFSKIEKKKINEIYNYIYKTSFILLYNKYKDKVKKYISINGLKYFIKKEHYLVYNLLSVKTSNKKKIYKPGIYYLNILIDKINPIKLKIDVIN